MLRLLLKREGRGCCWGGWVVEKREVLGWGAGGCWGWDMGLPLVGGGCLVSTCK